MTNGATITNIASAMTHSTPVQEELMNSALIALLEREFARLPEKGRPETLSEMSDVLNLDKATLSRLRNGKMPVNRNHARAIAEKLRKDAAERSELEEELLKAQPTLSHEQKVISEWFRERAHPEVLMIVEFREPPVLRPGAGRTLSDVTKAIIGGLSYAMVFPFARPSAKAQRSPVQLYLEDVYFGVEDTYKELLKQSLHAVHEGAAHADRKKELSEAELRSRLEDVVGRLKLYYLAKEQDTAYPGIGHRTFYVEDHRPTLDIVKRESWEWRVIGGRDQMVQKDPQPEQELRVMSDRFQPIIRFWSEKNRLAATARELYKRPSRLDALLSDGEDREKKETDGLWAVYGEKVTSAQIVDEFLKANE